RGNFSASCASSSKRRRRGRASTPRGGRLRLPGSSRPQARRRRSEGPYRPPGPTAETWRGGGRNGLTRTEEAAYMAVARLLSRPSFLGVPASETAPAVARVLALANQKGGVAKTTTTLNLGVALSEKGLRVLCIDLDPQGNLTMSQGLNPDAIERSMF